MTILAQWQENSAGARAGSVWTAFESNGVASVSQVRGFVVGRGTMQHRTRAFPTVTTR